MPLRTPVAGAVPVAGSGNASSHVPMSAIIADDEQLAREELRFLLDEIGDVEVVGTAANGIEALESSSSGSIPRWHFSTFRCPGSMAWE